MNRQVPLIKICGLMTKTAVDTSIKAGADMLGFVFFDPSPRSLSIENAAKLMKNVPKTVLKVALTVNADNSFLERIINNTPIDLVQFHGSEAETRMLEVKKRHKVGIINVIPVETASDLATAKRSETIADFIIFDAKAPKGSSRPGGNAKSFNWKCLAGFNTSIPWILAGGLNQYNVADAIKTSGARAVDVSSGVESSPGEKDPRKIIGFINAVKAVKKKYNFM